MENPGGGGCKSKSLPWGEGGYGYFLELHNPGGTRMFICENAHDQKEDKGHAWNDWAFNSKTLENSEEEYIRMTQVTYLLLVLSRKFMDSLKKKKRKNQCLVNLNNRKKLLVKVSFTLKHPPCVDQH